jgi:hypothetical protein
MSPNRCRAAASALLAAALVVVPTMAVAQQPFKTQRELRAVVLAQADGRNADQVRNEFRELMRQFPPNLGEVLKLDPALMTNQNYLQTYPGLAAFFTAHPEVTRDPGYYLDFARTARDIERERDYARVPRSAAAEQIQDIFTFLAVASAVGGIAFVLIWLVRTILAHRRWLRSTKLQMDIHNRLMERLSSSADVQAYLESAATNRLLLDMPVVLDSPAGRGAPVNRIIWSVQAGIVLGMAGIGLLIGQRYWPDAENVLTIPGVLILTVGAGFVLASAASYILSKRLGLLEPPAAASSAGRPQA